ncbi:methylated-DNA--[protein]-cysteine S-methyltransferase [Shewanella sedimentimangrovi]|uniref:Methylated-DNA--protein-cysteine methyltransferase n=1 Tax=Shewanella sedimentimangrovi TaxID=2814293 RepID=A0ABX7QXM4_9GAMM|nr:methylated-DNA--[protein]-cysteine S-methyltransferase [Shewanella sedimentimangrovi]QSX35989.1 methylated-DNA--[protein]-cysteine S-methyltransferase [Shewanella sedimentimangrovi]
MKSLSSNRICWQAAAEVLASAEYQSSVGRLYLAAGAAGLTHLTAAPLTGVELGQGDEAALASAKGHLAEAIAQLDEYFAGQRLGFELMLAPKGTAFQRRVWQALVDIAPGATCSYSQLADEIGNPKAVRAVGCANGANPIAIIVPCHRVIGKSGNLVGYAWGLSMKQALLDLETPAAG